MASESGSNDDFWVKMDGTGFGFGKTSIAEMKKKIPFGSVWPLSTFEFQQQLLSSVRYE